MTFVLNATKINDRNNIIMRIKMELHILGSLVSVKEHSLHTVT